VLAEDGAAENLMDETSDTFWYTEWGTAHRNRIIAWGEGDASTHCAAISCDSTLPLPPPLAWGGEGGMSMSTVIDGGSIRLVEGIAAVDKVELERCSRFSRKPLVLCTLGVAPLAASPCRDQGDTLGGC
jgi:hypothetical protein